MLPMSESKIAVPALPDLCVSRPRLLAALGRGAERGEDSVTGLRAVVRHRPTAPRAAGNAAGPEPSSAHSP
jgi:hypothetical protein